jgi:formate dehydrogenase iron-sulfur subunit
VTPGRVGEYLALQGDLSAVERFAEAHGDGAPPQQAKYYKALLPSTPPGPGQQYAFEVDLDRCSGCKACVTACHNLNGLDGGETWRSVGLLVGQQGLNETPRPTRLTARPACDVDTPSLAAPRFYQQSVTSACHHCADPACLNGCPVNAYDKNPITGIVKHLDDQCIGCQYCTYKCPYGVPQYNPARGIVRKCDMCSGRLSAGEAPACVQACPNEAIRIRLVSTAAPEGFRLPGAPDPAYTRPTTRYVSTRPLPLDAHPQDLGSVVPQHAEWPLVFMLILTQAAVGAFTVLPFFEGAPFRAAALAAAGAAHLGLALATLHLGRPLYAYRAVLNLRRSWLSREAAAFGGFAALATLTAALAWLPVLKGHLPLPLPAFVDAVPLRPLAALTALAGFAGVWCSAKIYMDTPRAWWASPATAAKFLLTCFTLGPALAAVAGAGRPGLFLLSVGAGLVKGTLELRTLAHRRGKPGDPLAGTAVLLAGPLQTLFQLRGALGLASLILLGAAAFLHTPALAAAGFAARLGAEVLERHLFFVAVVPPRMPGAL